MPKTVAGFTAKRAPRIETPDMRIDGITGLSGTDLREEVLRGGRFVFFEYCISFVIFTLRRPSPICFLRSGQWSWVRGMPYTLVSLLFGWWGLPWGFLYTPLVVMTNLVGGCDVTAQTCAYLGLQFEEEPPCDES
jgi:hypothetical protein